MPWLVRGSDVLASLEVAKGWPARLKGLLGRTGVEGALLLRPARGVHTLGMRFALDVAFCSADLTVLRVATVARHRLPRAPRGTRAVIEAEAGAFERWGLKAGDRLDVRG